MIVKFKKLVPEAVAPSKTHEWDAGYDLTATGVKWNNIFKCFEYSFGLSVEIPDGYVGLMFARSSIYKKDLTLTNAVGVIDAPFRGEMKALFKSTTEAANLNVYNIGDRIAQLVIIPIPQITFVETEELNTTQRGTNGWGSTDVQGKKS